jgi:hypothetical protein
MYFMSINTKSIACDYIQIYYKKRVAKFSPLNMNINFLFKIL